MAKSYDLAVIGTGAAATTVATAVRTAGWSVAVIDNRPFGGTCALRGCDPKKVLVEAARAVDAVRRLKGKGVAGEVGIAWPELVGFKRRFTDPVPEERARRFAEQGIDALRGTAMFVAPGRLDVAGEPHEARHVALAVGAVPIPLGIPGAEHAITSEDFMSLERLPRRIVMVGGGYIAAEFSHLAARAGAEVTVLQRAPRMLMGFDPDLVGWLMPRFRTLGIDVRTDTEVTAIEREGDALVVRTRLRNPPGNPKGAPWEAEVGSEAESSVAADLVVHAAGRAPDLALLDPMAAGIECDERGRLRLNEFLQSVSDATVYAAGDAAGAGPPLTPVASHDGAVVAANLLEPGSRKADYRGVPSVAFTIPPIAAVGLGEQAAREQGLAFRVNAAAVADWATARRVGETVYGYKVLVEEGTGRILGAHLVGPEADEVINLFALAIRHGITADALKSSYFAYPTAASDVSYML